jgi:hypothetical protein
MNWITYFSTEINCRPVTLLKSFSTTFEISIHQRLVQHVGNHNIISPEQFSCRKGFSTAHATYRLTELIYKAWNEIKNMQLEFSVS